jgi:antitoxin component YwqK of YwqJK toxin-antitoxin module
MDIKITKNMQWGRASMRLALVRLRTAVFLGCAGGLVCIAISGCNSNKDNTATDKTSDNSSEAGNLTASDTAGQATQAADKDSKQFPVLQEKQVPPPTFVNVVTVEELYPDKKLQIRRLVKRYSDDSMVNHGLYTGYYQNGQKLEEGNYVDGKKDGAWHMWYDNGQQAKVENYVDGQLDGQWTLLDKKGVKVNEVSFKAGKRDGHWVTYAADGKRIHQEEDYHDNKLNGTTIMWSDDGKKVTEMHFTNGQADGLQQEWFPNGQLKRQAEYKNGKKNGKEIRWNDKGEKELEEDFADGKQVRQPAEQK